MAGQRSVQTGSAPAPVGAYSQGIVGGQLMFVSGQSGRVASGDLPDTITEQTHQVLRNIEAILEAGGFSLRDVVKSTVHLRSIDDFEPFNAAYAEHFSDPLPVRYHGSVRAAWPHAGRDRRHRPAPAMNAWPAAADPVRFLGPTIQRYLSGQLG